MSGFLDRLEREHNDRAWLAWHMAACQRAKRMPKLKDMMSKPKIERGNKQSLSQIKGNLDALVARTGG